MGVSYIYVACRLLASALWRAHLQDDPTLQQQFRAGRVLRPASRPGTWADSRRVLQGVALVRRELLQGGGAHTPGVGARRLLGRAAFVTLRASAGSASAAVL